MQPYFPPSRDDASIIVILRSCVDVAQDVASFKRHAAASPAVPPPMIAMRSGRGGSHVAVHEQDGGQVMVSRPLTTLELCVRVRVLTGANSAMNMNMINRKNLESCSRSFRLS